MQYKVSTLTLATLATTAVLTLGIQQAHANGAHFLVDDADITPPGECAVETWFQRASVGGASFHGLEVQPMCSTRNGWEIALPLAYNTSDSELAGYGLELKTMLSTDFYGGALALSFGVMRDHQESEFEGGFINVPYSAEISDAVMLHVNLGVEYDKFESDWNPTWGLASTFTVHERLDLIVETAGVGSDSPAAAVGFRSALNDRIELDASYARDFEDKVNVLTIGLNIAF
ncbi:hypothetical protein Q3O59_08615 [Alkalimonas delamerensis]|uniref:Outer membrane protein beta-barrel domain-containing protein n=1 Tax=Alkalimonas delamerensis TaxID=265981 RepID=A0ABT9GR07_9GAMM|nr:hypothetical protein [Alkalimonas delamerensis]MDP4529091.1 hypothetical protein [Alkalimonas delamerensis]